MQDLQLERTELKRYKYEYDIMKEKLTEAHATESELQTCKDRLQAAMEELKSLKQQNQVLSISVCFNHEDFGK